MMMPILDTPEKMAHYATDNSHLQAFYLQFLQIKDADERAAFSKVFWLKVEQLDADEQTAIKVAQSHIAQRLYDRMGSSITELGKIVHKKELVFQD
jgi:hypothetical protein